MVRALTIGLAVVALAAATYVLFPRTDGPRPFDPYTDEYELSDDVRRHLWEVERRAFILTNEVCPELGRALADGDAEEWELCFREAMTATIPAGPGRTGVHGSLVSHSDWDPGAPVRTVDAAGLVAWLIELRQRYEPGGHVSVHFESMVPADRSDLDGAYDVSWTVRLRGTLRAGGLGTTDVTCVMRLDHPPQGADTEWITSWTTTDFRETRAPRPLMEEITDTCGIDTLALLDRWAATESEEMQALRSYASYLLDYDRDGTLDLLFCDRRLWLYRGLGDGRFEDVTSAAGLAALGAGLFRGGTVGDFDSDGDEDLLLLALQVDGKGTVVGLENMDGFFRRVSDRRLRHPEINVQDGAVADFDRDGDIDIYYPLAGRTLPDDQVRMRWIGNRHAAEGALVRNLGDWKFEDVTRTSGALSGHRDIFAAAWTDLDRDHYPDLVLAHHLGENVILHNRGDGTFHQEVVAGGFGGFSMGLAVGDLDGDGDEDAYFANMGSFAGTRIIENLRPDDYPPGVLPLVQGWVQGNVVLENRPDGFTEAFEHYAGWAYGPAVFDLDGDGLLDLFSPAGFQTISRDKPDG